MACEIVVMNPQVEVNPATIADGLYQPSWCQPLSPDMGSPVAAHSPIDSCYSPADANSPLMHAASPIGSCYSPVDAHSPLMHAGSPSASGACSPVGAQSPPVPSISTHEIKQEFEDNLHYDSCNLHSLLTPVPMCPPQPREILDGTLHRQVEFFWYNAVADCIYIIMIIVHHIIIIR